MTTEPMWRSFKAVVIGFIAVVGLSIGTDVVMHSAGIFPPPDQPMRDSSLLLLALFYRTLYGIFGAYLTARLAPSKPMQHALFGGAVGFVLAVIGAIAMWNHGPNWYPVALALTAIPGAWFGARINAKLRGER